MTGSSIMNLKLIQPIAVFETVFASDETGFGTSRKSEYFTVVINSQAKKDDIKSISIALFCAIIM